MVLMILLTDFSLKHDQHCEKNASAGDMVKFRFVLGGLLQMSSIFMISTNPHNTKRHNNQI